MFKRKYTVNDVEKNPPEPPAQRASAKPFIVTIALISLILILILLLATFFNSKNNTSAPQYVQKSEAAQQELPKDKQSSTNSPTTRTPSLPTKNIITTPMGFVDETTTSQLGINLTTENETMTQSSLTTTKLVNLTTDSTITTFEATTEANIAIKNINEMITTSSNYETSERSIEMTSKLIITDYLTTNSENSLTDNRLNITSSIAPTNAYEQSTEKLTSVATLATTTEKMSNFPTTIKDTTFIYSSSTKPSTITRSTPSSAGTNFTASTNAYEQSREKLTFVATLATTTEKMLNFTTTKKDTTFIYSSSTQPTTITRSIPLLAGTSSTAPINAYEQSREKFVSVTKSLVPSNTEKTWNFSTTKLDKDTTDASTKPSTSIVRPTAPAAKIRMLPVPAEKKICSTKNCLQSGAQILSRMDFNGNPCEDFYQYACGNDAEISEKNALNLWHRLLQRRKDEMDMYPMNEFYESCLNYESSFNYSQRMTNLEDQVMNVGKFAFSEENIDFTELFTKLLLHQSNPIFDIGIDVSKNGKLQLQLILPGGSALKSGLKKWSSLSYHKKNCVKNVERSSASFNRELNLNALYDSYSKCNGDFTHYLNSIEGVLNALKPFKELSDDKERRKHIKEIRWWIESEIINKTIRNVAEIESNYLTKNYKLFAIDKLQAVYGFVNWHRMLQNLTGQNGSFHVQVYFDEHFKRVFSLLGQMSAQQKSKLNNALLAIYANDLFMNTVIPREIDRREQFCADLSKQLMPNVWSDLVKFNGKFHGSQLDETIALIHKTFASMLISPVDEEQIKWIGDKSREMLQDKLNWIKFGFFTPTLNVTLNNFDYDPLANFQQQFWSLIAQLKRAIFGLAGHNLDEEIVFSYFLDPMSDEPLSFYHHPLIAVPIGLLEKARSKDLPIYLTLARVGFRLAREIFKHFDPTGIKFFPKPNDDVLSSTEMANYNTALVQHTENLLFTENSKRFNRREIRYSKANSKMSVHAIVRDNAAFRLVLNCFNDLNIEESMPWLNSAKDEQIFYVAAAQDFCKPQETLGDFMIELFEKSGLPAALRIDNIMRNSESFADSYKCKEGQGMNMEDSERRQFPYLPINEDDEDKSE